MRVTIANLMCTKAKFKGIRAFLQCLKLFRLRVNGGSKADECRAKAFKKFFLRDLLKLQNLLTKLILIMK